MARDTTPQRADRIETLGFSARTKNALRREHITTVGDLLTCDRNELLDIRSFGPVCLDEVVRTLAAHGLELKPVTRYRPVEDIELPDTPHHPNGDSMTTTTTEPYEHGDPRIGSMVDTDTWRAVPAPKIDDGDPLDRLGGHCIVAGDGDETDVWIEVTAEYPKAVAEFIVQAVRNEHISLTQTLSKAADYDLRDDLQSLTPPMPGTVWIKDVIAHVEPELVKLREERDLAIAHDRQPYPTAWAYAQACMALAHHRQHANEAEVEAERLRTQLRGVEKEHRELVDRHEEFWTEVTARIPSDVFCGNDDDMQAASQWLAEQFAELDKLRGDNTRTETS